ncbi:ABC transporter ATP-binding protein [Prochlorococcus sp. MIT 1341]|uniref:ABC transporter ATP-binding protein n=1 Tax=Prochlorococcus sp. MIT 1341 TaxID=3096221 RepID=UPI002A7494A5|nr:ABC transporter ATP-binding protein [Prochlorococcus sp. MIT 1341]
MSNSELNNKQDLSTQKILLIIFSSLSKQRKVHVSGVLLVMITCALLEFSTLIVVTPFLLSISEPEAFKEAFFVRLLQSHLGAWDSSKSLLLMSVIFGFLAIFTAMIKILNLWSIEKLVAAIGCDFSCEAFRRTLYQPYNVHLSRNSSFLVNVITRNIDDCLVTIRALMQFITSFLTIIALLIALTLVDSSFVIAAFLLFSLAYAFIASLLKRRLNRNSKVASISGEKHVKVLREGLGAIRDILIDGTQNFYLKIYRQADESMRAAFAQANFFAYSPKLILEALGLFALVIITFFTYQQKGSSVQLLPILGTVAFCAQRLLPAMQQCYIAWANLNSSQVAINDVISLVNQPLGINIDRGKCNQFTIEKSIEIVNLSFSYSKDREEVLKGVDFEIKKGERVAIVGQTGSGKSTLMTLLMGLLRPTKGYVFVNGLDINSDTNLELLEAWKSSIAHVPQNIYLADTTIAENIAFGQPRDLINIESVRSASKQAMLDQFVSRLPYGYGTLVGERGSMLSGGQRQRLGIARALYKGADVLFFDEATSALDDEIESSIINTIRGLSKDLTIIVIAHRKSSIEMCDKILRLSDGAIV